MKRVRTFRIFASLKQFVIKSWETSLNHYSLLLRLQHLKRKKARTIRKFRYSEYDGVRAQKIGQVAYAIKCFTEALKCRRISRR